MALIARRLFHRFIFRVVVRTLFRLKVIYVGEFRSMDQLIIVANHNSHLDTFLLFLAMPISCISSLRPVAGIDYFNARPLLFALANFLFKPIWIDRVREDGAVVDSLIDAIDKGDSLILFPEGTRGQAGKIAQFKTGIGRILERRPHIPVVPAGIIGTDRSFPRGRFFPKFVRHCVVMSSARCMYGYPADISSSLRETIVELIGTIPATENNNRRRKPQIICTVGIDGSGKSSLSRKLAREHSNSSRVWYVGDKLEYFKNGQIQPRAMTWLEPLRQCFTSYSKHSSNLAVYKIPKLIELILRDLIVKRIAQNGDAELIVIDGCPVINLLAWANLYHEDIFNSTRCSIALTTLTGGSDAKADESELIGIPEFSLMKRLRLNKFQLPDTSLFLDLEPEIAIRRIEARNEFRQAHEQLVQLVKLRAAYKVLHELLLRHPNVIARKLDAAFNSDVLVKQATTIIKENDSCIINQYT